jgi:hypothetical protein
MWELMSMHFAELLIRSGLVTTDQLEQILKNPEDTLSLPLGQALIFAGFLTTDEANEAVRVQSLLKRGQISVEQAVEQLVQLRETTRATSSPTPVPAEEAGANRVGQLLLDADMISQADLHEALKDSKNTRRMFARILVNTKKVPEDYVDNALEIGETCVQLVDKAILTPEQAVKVLHNCCKKSLSLPAALFQLGIGGGSDD